MSIVIRIVANGVAGFKTPLAGRYVKDVDFEAHFGIGHITGTPIKTQAKRFDSLAAALTYWKTQSKVCPLRDDGLPNRPLTAFTVTFEEVEDPQLP